MPDCFTETTDGMFYAYNGIDLPVRWDSFLTQFETVGVVGPPAAPVMTGFGSGNIVGRFYAFVRYYDRLGNFSNLSPQSVLLNPSSGQVAITDASQTAPIQITSGTPHLLTTGQIVLVDSVNGNTSANGIWSATVTGPLTFTLDNSTANSAYIGGGTFTTGVASIIYSNVAIPLDPKVVGRQILRNKDGNANTFYIDIDTADLTSDIFISTQSSSDLQNGVALFDSAGNDLAVTRYDLPPNFKAVVANYLGRVFAAVNADYSEGCVSMAFGSTSVTGIGTEWNASFAGRYLDVAGSDAPYLILSATGNSLTLANVYTGPTDPYAQYSIHVAYGERRTLYWSEAGLAEAWPTVNGRTIQEDAGAGDFVGLMPLNSWLFIVGSNRMWRFASQGDPNNDAAVQLSFRRGAINNRCWVMVEEIIYMLDFSGVHAFAGNDDDASVGRGVQDIFDNNPANKYRINWGASRYFHAIQDPGEEVVRFFVALSGWYTPHHALCYHYRLKRWWIEEFSMPIGASCLGRINGRPQVFYGTSAGRILAANSGTLDGPAIGSGTIRGTMTATGPTWFTDSTALFPTAGLVGFPVVIVGGLGKGQKRTISSVVGTTINVTQPWTIQPDTTSQYQSGGIPWVWRAAWFEWAQTNDEVKRAVAVQYKPTQTPANMDLALYRDYFTTPQAWMQNQSQAQGNGIGSTAGNSQLTIDSTKASGFAQIRLDGFRDWYTDGPRLVSTEVSGVQSDSAQYIYGVRIDGVGAQQ